VIPARAPDPMVAAVLRSFGEVEAVAAATFPVHLLDPVRHAIARILRADSNAGAVDPASPEAEVAVRYAEQFVVDVSGVGPELRAEFGSTFGAGSFELVQALYVFDVFTRARIALRRFDEEPTVPNPRPSAEPGELWQSLETFMRSVARLDALDAVTSELVRLRGARLHGCRLCLSRRSLRALEAAGEETFSPDARPSSERHAAAIELVDLLVTQPSEIDAHLVQRIRTSYDTREIVELILDVVRNAANKIAVAFAADAPNVVDGIEFFDIDADGEVVADIDADVVRRAAPRAG
jgi:AhpD family alkylhydroperoxidase